MDEYITKLTDYYEICMTLHNSYFTYHLFTELIPKTIAATMELPKNVSECVTKITESVEYLRWIEMLLCTHPRIFPVCVHDINVSIGKCMSSYVLQMTIRDNSEMHYGTIQIGIICKMDEVMSNIKSAIKTSEYKKVKRKNSTLYNLKIPKNPNPPRILFKTVISTGIEKRYCPKRHGDSPQLLAYFHSSKQFPQRVLSSFLYARKCLQDFV